MGGKNRDSTSQRGRKTTSGSVRRDKDGVKESRGESESNSHKRRRTNPDPSTSTYQNPFGPNADIPLAESTNELDVSPPLRTWTQVPQDQYTYGYTPKLTVQEQEMQMIAPLDSDSLPPLDTPDAPPDTTASSIDPSLFHPTLHLLQSPSNPFATSPSAPTATINPFAKPIRAPAKHTTLLPKSALSAQTPTPAPTSSCLLPAAIPKAVTDKLANQAARITELEVTVKNLQLQLDAVSTLENERADAQVSTNRNFQDMDDELHAVDRRATAIEDKLGRHYDLISDLFEQLKMGRSKDEREDDDEEEEVKSKKKGKKKAGRDNALNNATRCCLYVAMGLPKKSKLKDAASITTKKRGGGYISDEESNGQLLRPDWRVGFTENASWHTPMVRFLRNKTPSLVPALTKDIMANKSDDVLLERLEVLFTNIAAEYRKLARDGGKDDDEEEVDEGEDGDDEGPVDENQLNRRSGRKVRKCNERIETIEEANIEVDDDWEFFFQPTETKDEPPVRSTRKPWVTHAPDYRSGRLQNGIEFIDKVLMERRHQWAKNNHGKTMAHDRVRGEIKHKPLPFIKGNKKRKIKRTAIDPTWLAQNPDQDTPSRIQESDNEAAAAEKVKVPAIVEDGSSDSGV
ncbi:hypothetical protein B0H16DRAFT_1737814 [Mycena metata]|uniref:Uncharacterized protein n=1 Tax=Mycena metata TaxID=1033252 RepID=A0AAD7HJX7_9AGAR|nr:hypothetical protein B0H16DRAFT_1737814 [Mycena metata]